MDKVRKFDEEFRSIYKDTIYMNNVATGLICCLGIMFMMIPFDIKDGLISWYGGLLCIMGIEIYMKSYLSVKENGNIVSIYKKLSYMPVTKSEIRKVRVGYLNRICIRIGVAAFILQQLVSLLNRSFGFQSVIFALVWAAAVWGIEMLRLYTY